MGCGSICGTQPCTCRHGQACRELSLAKRASHCGKGANGLIDPDSGWNKQFKSIDDWSGWLAEGDETEEIQMLRKQIEKGLPCGAESFIKRLSKMVGRDLEYRPQGRPKKVEEA